MNGYLIASAIMLIVSAVLWVKVVRDRRRAR
jgi:hypothetical protein